MTGRHADKTRSIARTLSVGLITTLILVAGLSLVVNYLLSSRKAQTELEIRAEEYVWPKPPACGYCTTDSLAAAPRWIAITIPATSPN